MSWKKHSVLILVIFISGFVGVVFLNYIVDPFEIFKTKLLPQHYQPNERYLKIDYLLNNKNKFNSFIFGSSRVAQIQPKSIEKFVPGAYFYNMSVSAANMGDYFKFLSFFLSNGFKLKNIFMQIDLDVMDKVDQENADYLRKHHFMVTGESPFRFYVDYLTVMPIINIKGKMIANYKNLKGVLPASSFDLDTGTGDNPFRDYLRSKDLKEYVKNEPTFHNDVFKKIRKKEEIIKSIILFKKIIDLCNENNINIIVLTTPLNHKLLDTVSTDDVIYYVSKLVKYHDIWYLSNYNSITNDDKNYYELSHYDKKVGQMILSKIFKNKGAKASSDFGFLLTIHNFKKYLSDNLI